MGTCVTHRTTSTDFRFLRSMARCSKPRMRLSYHERWEIELGLRDIKSSMQDNALTLRSKTVDLVHQELWGPLLAYNLVRREASQAAVAHKRASSEGALSLPANILPFCSHGRSGIPLAYTKTPGGCCAAVSACCFITNAPDRRCLGRLKCQRLDIQ